MTFGVWELLIVLVIVLLLFGTKRLRNIGGDVGEAIKNFKKSVGDESAEKKPVTEKKTENGHVIDAKVEKKSTSV